MPSPLLPLFLLRWLKTPCEDHEEEGLVNPKTAACAEAGNSGAE
jgi:hypothetical protein